MSTLDQSGQDPTKQPCNSVDAPKPQPRGQKLDLRLVPEAHETPAPDILGGGPDPGPDPDDLAAAIVNQDYLNKAESDLVARPLKIRKPGRDFFRVFPHFQYFNLYTDEVDGKIDKNYYFVMPQMAAVMEGETSKQALILCVNTHGIPFFWPIREREVGNDNWWTESAWDAVRRGIEKWVKIRANQKPGAGYYDVRTAKDDLGAPEFPTSDEAGYMALLNAATPDERKIKNLDHPIIAKVEGRRK
jgi:hypothetical protein